jgi:hypothetical protein
MKTVLLALATAALATVAFAGLDGSTITLLAPEGDLFPGETYDYKFHLERDNSSDEYVSEIHIVFPAGMQPITFTQGYDELEPGRPDFNQWSYLERASWWERDPTTGGVHEGESMDLWVKVSTSSILPDGLEGTILWRIVGNESSVKEGLVGVQVPVRPAAWSRIKSMYR